MIATIGGRGGTTAGLAAALGRHRLTLACEPSPLAAPSTDSNLEKLSTGTIRNRGRPQYRVVDSGSCYLINPLWTSDQCTLQGLQIPSTKSQFQQPTAVVLDCPSKQVLLLYSFHGRARTLPARWARRLHGYFFGGPHRPASEHNPEKRGAAADRSRAHENSPTEPLHVQKRKSSHPVDRPSLPLYVVLVWLSKHVLSDYNNCKP